MELSERLGVFVVFIGVIGLSVLAAKIYRSLRLKRKLLRLFPTPAYHWFLGHLDTFPGFNARGMQWLLDNTMKYPRYYVFLIGPTNASVHLNHPETIRKLTNTAAPKQIDVSAYGFIKPWIGEGLVLSSGAKWRRNRRLLTPGFHSNVLKQYFTVYNDCADILLKNFTKYAVKTGQSMDVFEPVGLCTFDVIMQCAFSTSLDVQNMEVEQQYHKTAAFLARQCVERSIKPHLYSDAIYAMTSDGRRFREACAYTHAFADNLIAERKEAMKRSSCAKTVDFLDILLQARDENDNGLSDLEIRDEVETFMVAGHDTTRSAISWCLYNLAKHPEIQSRVCTEVEAVLQGRIDRRVTADDMTSFPYLKRCVKESLRMHPPVPFIGRTLEHELEIEPGNVLPPGTNVSTMIWNLHHNPEVWPDHMTYDPDRFLPENIKHMDSHAFIPFSAGRRNCIGQHFAINEMLTVVVRILDQFTLRLDSEKEVNVHPDAVLRPENGIYIYFSENAVQF